MRKSKLMRHPVAWIQRGSDAWFGLAAALTNAVITVSLARVIGGERLGERRLARRGRLVRDLLLGHLGARRLARRRRDPRAGCKPPTTDGAAGRVERVPVRAARARLAASWRPDGGPGLPLRTLTRKCHVLSPTS